MAAMAVPSDSGFWMPAEWAPHAACWMGWPCRAEVFGDRRGARAAFAETARRIAEFEKVFMLARPEDAAGARRQLGGAAEVLECPLNDSWLRDFGPTFLKNAAGETAGVDWRFNAWGEKYAPYDLDGAVAKRILAHAGARRFCAPLVMEGGAFHTDGEGTALATEQCLLHPNRNPSMGREEIEKYLREYLGAHKIIWLAGDERDDETDGHVDQVACFAAPGTVLAVSPQGDKVLTENIRRLRAATDARGRKLKTVEMPRPEVRENEKPLLASYINFYLANGAVIMPSFGAAEDDAAKAILAEVFPRRKIEQVPAVEIVKGGGGIHCITQQQPA